jgi:hypothetical protein
MNFHVNSEQGADPNVRNYSGQVALHVAGELVMCHCVLIQVDLLCVSITNCGFPVD